MGIGVAARRRCHLFRGWTPLPPFCFVGRYLAAVLGMAFFRKDAGGGDDGGVVASNDEMIRAQIIDRGISNPAVVDALRRTDRREFVPESAQADCYGDRPIMLQPGATVSQPYIVALMTDLLRVGPGHRVLEIGTGSGYQAAVLSLLAQSVYGVELQEELVEFARVRLRGQGRDNVMVIHGDGWRGYAAAAPYDRILVTAAAASVPDALIDQLALPGRMVAPIGAGRVQDLEVIDKSATGEVSRTVHSGVQFVPLVNRDIPDPMRERA